MAQKVTSNDIRIYPMSARGSATNQYGTNFMSEYNISTIPRQLLGSDGFVITSELPSKVPDANNEWQDIDYFEFNIYGYYVKVKLSAIETAINGTKGADDDSDGYVEDFVWFTIDLENNIVYANIRVLEATGDETYTVLCGSDSETYKSDNIESYDNKGTYTDESGNTYTLVSLPILTAMGSGTSKYIIDGIYKDSCLNLINLNGINITTNSGELKITEKSITTNNDFTLNSDTINLNGNTNTTGNATISKDVIIGGNTAIGGNTSINSNLDVKENITVENQLYVRKDDVVETGSNGETTIVSTTTNKIGSSINPIYMNDGTFIPSSETVGSVSKPVYLNSGTIEEASNIYAGKTIKIGDGASTQTSENSYALHSIAIGSNATANGSYSIAIGDEAKAYYANSIAIGKGASPANENDIALGTQTVGNTAQPIYLNKGVVTALTGNIGNSITPIYMSGGTLTVSTGNVGSEINPVYLSSGVITKSSSNKGAEVQANNNTDGTFTPIYLNNGELTAATTTIGSTVQPVYMNKGTFTSTNATIGSATQPIYMDSGTLKEADITFDEPETVECDFYYSSNNFTGSFSTVGSYYAYEVGLGAVKLVVLTLRSDSYYNSKGDNIYVADFGENAKVYGAWWMPVTHDVTNYGNYDYGAYVTSTFSTSSGAAEATTSISGRYAVWWSDQMSTSTRGAKFYAIVQR